MRLKNNRELDAKPSDSNLNSPIFLLFDNSDILLKMPRNGSDDEADFRKNKNDYNY